MRTICALLTIGMAVAGAPAADTASAPAKLHAKVLYLQGMESREAMTLLRSQLQVRQMASFNDRDLVVVAGTAQKVEASESLLRERDALRRVASPHQSVAFSATEASQPISTVFRVADDKTPEAVVLLRSIYQMRGLSEFPQDNSVSVQATQPVLDASEAMLRELGLLAAPVDEIRSHTPIEP